MVNLLLLFLSEISESFALFLGMKKANKTTWDALLEIYKNETDASERLKLMKGLTSIENEDILKKYVLGFFEAFLR